MQDNEAGCPVWARRVINLVNNIPLLDLKAHIRAEAQALPELLDKTPDLEFHREELLALATKCDRLLQATQQKPAEFKDVTPLKPNKIRKELTAEAGELLMSLDHDGERFRAARLFRMRALCHRALGIALALMMLGTCPVCEFAMQMPMEDPVEIASQEISLAG